MSNKLPFTYSPFNSIQDKDGSGNNWACGYNNAGSIHKEKVLSKLRHLMEKEDGLDKINFIHSLSGGTGSGLGSKLLEVFKDEFGQIQLDSYLIGPSLCGEIPLQNYNTIFSLSNALDFASNVFVFQNDLALK